MVAAHQTSQIEGLGGGIESGGALATALLVLALALLAWSFAVDVRWLYHTRPQS